MSMLLAHKQSTIHVTLLLCLESLIMSIYLVAIPYKYMYMIIIINMYI